MGETAQASPAAWHSLEIDEILSRLKADPEKGLSQEEANRRLEQYGPNELVETGLKSPWLILWEQFTDAMVVVLIVAAIISFLLGDALDGIVILAIVVLNGGLGFVQEYRAEQAMAALKKLSAPVVRVRRGGHVVQVDSHKIVPGDIVLLEAGSMIPADARVIEAANLRVQEAALTGESEPVDKHTDPIQGGSSVPLGDRINMLYKGTVVTYGRGTAIVVETGMRTELGRIANLIQSVENEQTPLQRRMAQLSRSLAVAALVIVAIVFALGLLRGEDLLEMFYTAIAMAVAAVPEGLPAVVTIALALGAQRMLKRKALIRKLPAVETLGSVTVICSDKTGTLTENRMTVTILDVAGHRESLTETLGRGHKPLCREDDHHTPSPVQRILLIGGALCNDALLECEDEEKGYEIVGDPTEGALLVVAARFGLWKEDLEHALPRVAEVPFSSERKRMSTIHRIPAEHADLLPPEMMVQGSDLLLFTKGGVDSMLEVSTHVWVDGEIKPLDDHWRERILNANNELAQDGLRVLGLGFRFMPEIPDTTDEAAVERDLIFVGMLAMIDPPRPEVKRAVETCKTAGIRPVMITGDHPLTAYHIARDLGIVSGQDGRVITGVELAEMPPEELDRVVPEVSVYARVSPEHKLRIVEALQRHGHIVAMTGDGVNDAPALRKGDIGVAMGITGTDVSKEASDMVILDDNFATIVAAVEEGRNIFDNVRKFIKYTMTSNTGEIWVMLLGPLLGMPLPLTALQILWINLVTDGLPGLALGVEPPERNTMQRPPYAPNESVFARGMGRHILSIGFLMGLVSLGIGLWVFRGRGSDSYWQTMVFTTLTLSQMGHALAIRSERDSLFRIGLFSNKALLGAVLLTFVLQIAVIYIPLGQALFETEPLSLIDLLISLGLSTVVFWAVELEKLISRHIKGPDESHQAGAAPHQA
ncbi:MAG: cation-translocating P-type ATPase [Anaerolineae bacterium]